ncbi:hypothetical protein [Streptomyces sp. NPDC058385]|uniref:hypothetical protein n=1 Tax=Streptomyces sp. NPDC058385 TaxID=3346473 RepID=UPI00365533CA
MTGSAATHLVPVVEVDFLDQLNVRLAQIDEDEDERMLQGKPTSIGFNLPSKRTSWRRCRSMTSSAG